MKYSSSEFYKIMESTGAKKLNSLLMKSDMRYSFNSKKKLYSVKFFVKFGRGKKKERILTLVLSPKYSEYILSDGKGKPLEFIRQNGRSLVFGTF